MLNIEQNKLIKYTFYFLTALLFFYSIELISQLIIYQIQDELKVRVWWYTDLPSHIRISISGHERYSLLYLIFALIYKIFTNQASIVVFILIIIFSTIILAGKYLYKNTNANNMYVCLILALFAYIEAAVYIIPLSPARHVGLYMSGIWHNSSLIAMKFAMLIILILFNSIADKINKKIKLQVKDYLIFTFALTIGAWIKPNLAFVMYPAIGLMCLIWFFKDKTLLKQLLALILTFTPTIVILIIQTKIMFPNKTGEAFGIAPFIYFNHWYNIHKYPTILVFLSTLFQSYSFPLAALVLLRKKLKEMYSYTFVWICTVIGILEAILIIETGPRIFHGNWIWGAYGATFLLYLVTIEYLIKNAKSIWQHSLFNKIWLIICSALLIMHTVYGYLYMHHILSTGMYY